MASTYLHSNTGTATNAKKFTLSMWIKRGSLCGGTSQRFYQGYKDSNDRFYVMFDSGTADTLWIYAVSSGTTQVYWTSSRRFRDTNGWYNFVFSADSTQASQGDRFKVYVNGVEETAWTKNNNPSQDIDWGNQLAQSNNDLTISGTETQTQLFDGSMSHIHFIDGTAYDATAFGSFDNDTGEWKINTSPSVTYGNNGYFILKDGNSVTDSSPNSNDFSVGAGTLTNTEDNPSNVFATLNPLTGNCTFSNGNNTWVGTTSGYEHSSATLGASSGKYYWEVKPTNSCGAMGITDFNWQFDKRGSIIYASSGYAWVYEGNGYVSHETYGDIATNYSSYTSSDIIGVALDLDNNKLYFHKNGTYENSGDPTSGATGTGAISIDAPSSLPSGFYSPLVADLCGASAGGGSVNFGNGYFGTTQISSEGTNASGIGKFEFDVPAGYTALSTKGLNA